MEQVGIRALKQNASAVVARAAAGESLTITEHGRPVARLTPLEESTMARLIASGAAVKPRRPLCEMPAPSQGGDISAALREMRDAERY